MRQEITWDLNYWELLGCRLTQQYLTWCWHLSCFCLLVAFTSTQSHIGIFTVEFPLNHFCKVLWRIKSDSNLIAVGHAVFAVSPFIWSYLRLRRPAFGLFLACSSHAFFVCDPSACQRATQNSCASCPFLAAPLHSPQGGITEILQKYHNFFAYTHPSNS